MQKSSRVETLVINEMAPSTKVAIGRKKPNINIRNL